MKRQRSALKLAATAALVSALSLAAPAYAANHALIMWIGDYGSPSLNLPGIDKDAAMARRMATAMGVPGERVREVANRALTRESIIRELSSLTARINSGDKVFIYFSGHGHQQQGVSGARCTESLVTFGPDQFFDTELQTALDRLGDKAGQVVMMNDSCFSGGAAAKSRGLHNGVAKFFPSSIKGSSVITQDHQCGDAVNKISRNLEVMEARPTGPRVLYLAASSDIEVAYATPDGSVATLAWTTCLESATADTNRSGAINGAELQACSQRYVNENTRFTQTIVLQGQSDLPVSFAATSSPPTDTEISPVDALRDLRNLAAKDFHVELTAPRTSLRIRQDMLDFSVQSSRPGYLYLLQVGSDGKTINVLFPNQLDAQNRISAGVHQFPRPNWRLRSSGPEGTTYLMAIVTDTPKDVTKHMDWRGAFAYTNATAQAMKTLFVEAAGGTGGGDAFGASQILEITERP